MKTFMMNTVSRVCKTRAVIQVFPQVPVQVPVQKFHRRHKTGGSTTRPTHGRDELHSTTHCTTKWGYALHQLLFKYL